jgi:hypothetical protein
MLIRLGLNAAVHAAAGVAVAGLAVVAVEGWRRAYKAGNAGTPSGRDPRGGETWGSNIEDDDRPLEDEPPVAPADPPRPSDAGPGGPSPAPGPTGGSDDGPQSGPR